MSYTQVETLSPAEIADQLIKQVEQAAKGNPGLEIWIEAMKGLEPDQMISLLVEKGLLLVQDREPNLVDECFSLDDEASVLAKINNLDPALINTKSAFDVTLLHEAACRGYLQATKRLLELGADPSAVNTLGETAAQRCRLLGFTEIADLLS